MILAVLVKKHSKTHHQSKSLKHVSISLNQLMLLGVMFFVLIFICEKITTNLIALALFAVYPHIHIHCE